MWPPAAPPRPLPAPRPLQTRPHPCFSHTCGGSPQQGCPGSWCPLAVSTQGGAAPQAQAWRLEWVLWALLVTSDCSALPAATGRPRQGTRWWQVSRTTWTLKISLPAGPCHPRAPCPARTSLCPARRRQRRGQGTPRLQSWPPRSVLSQRPDGVLGRKGRGARALAGGKAGGGLRSLTLFCVPRSSTKALGPPRDAAPRAAKPRPEGPSGKLEEGTDKPVSSESDAEGPIAAQMLSFVMDDPDFESDSDAQRRAVRTSLAPVLLASPGQPGGRGSCRPMRGGSQG